MTFSVMASPLGLVLADEATIIDFQPFPRDAEEVSTIFLNLKNGVKNSTINSIVEKFDEKLKGLEQKDVLLEVEDLFLHQYIQNKLQSKIFFVKATTFGAEFRAKPDVFLAQMDGMTLEEFFAFNKQVNLELTKAQIKSVSEQNDRLIMQAVNAIDDIYKSTNIFSERIREWYGFHFPELTDQLISDHEFFLEIITNIGTRDEFSAERLQLIRPLQDQNVNIILKRAKESMGGDFAPYDIKTVQQFAKSVLDLYKTRAEIEDYVEALMEHTCPNLTGIIGALLGARLICLAGGLEELAKKPSSTIQVLGAEKALFRSLKTHSEPPKHGVIFQATYIRNAPYWHRGKIARLLAGKISIAAKVDTVSKRYIADELLEDIKKKIEEIKRKYPDKPVEKKTGHATAPQYGRGPAQRGGWPQGAGGQRYGGRPQGAGGPRPAGRPQGAGGQRYGGKPQGAGDQRYGGRPQGAGGQRYGGKPQGAGGPRPAGRPQGDGEQRYGGRPQGAGGSRPAGKSQGGSGQRYGGKPQGAGGKPQGKYPPKSLGGFQGKPRGKPAGKRPQGKPRPEPQD
jgi:nucleolar protein 56